jgi:hypothetical protein
MTYDTAIALDQIGNQLQSEVVFNGNANAVSASALFGVKAAQGLDLTLYGGNFPLDTGFAVIADTHIRLTASATNYIYVTAAGAITKVTSAPTGWPGPMVLARALYQLTVGTDAITSGTMYRVWSGGPVGAQGAVGIAGPNWHTERRMAIDWVGDDNVTANTIGVEIATLFSGTYTAWTLSDANNDCINQVAAKSNSSAASVTSGVRSARNFCTRGSATGRGGFDVRMRWAHNQVNLATMRCFAGLYNISAGNPSATVDPSSLLNIVGVGIDTADSGNDLRLMHNDGTGTATKTTLTGFGARKNDVTGYWPVYDLRLWCTAFASTVNWSLHNQYNATETSGVISSDLPADTAFLGFLLYTNTGPTGGAICYPNPMQFFGVTRY